MGKTCSVDLRSRVIKAVLGGSTMRAAASRYGVAISSAVKWTQRYRRIGDMAAGARGGDRRSRLKGERLWLLRLVERRPDLTLREIRDELGGARGLWVSPAAVWRFLAKERLSFKKKPSRQRARAARRGQAARAMEAVSR